MREIIDIQYVEDKVSKDKKKYKITHALLDDGEEVQGYGDDFKQGDLVEVFFHEQYGKVKMRKTPKHNA